jgi:hypothetical protein
MSDKPHDEKKTQAEDSGGGSSGSSMTLIEKIKHTLTSTAPERWEQGGEPLDTNRRFQRAQNTWEEIFSTDTKSGVLVLRSSTPLASNFFAGGYSFSPAGPPRYLIELRGRGWSPKMLLDPAFRGSGGVERTCQILAEGDVAQQLFREVEQIVKNFRETMRRDFNDSVARLMSNLKENIGQTEAADWSSVEGDVGYKGYRTEINGLTLTVGSISNDLSTAFSLSLSRMGLIWHCRDPFLMQEIFKLVDESVRTASLEQLGKVLEDML